MTLKQLNTTEHITDDSLPQTVGAKKNQIGYKVGATSDSKVGAKKHREQSDSKVGSKFGRKW